MNRYISALDYLKNTSINKSTTLAAEYIFQIYHSVDESHNIILFMDEPHITDSTDICAVDWLRSVSEQVLSTGAALLLTLCGTGWSYLFMLTYHRSGQLTTGDIIIMQ